MSVISFYRYMYYVRVPISLQQQMHYVGQYEIKTFLFSIMPENNVRRNALFEIYLQIKKIK